MVVEDSAVCRSLTPHPPPVWSPGPSPSSSSSSSFSTSSTSPAELSFIRAVEALLEGIAQGGLPPPSELDMVCLRPQALKVCATLLARAETAARKR